MFLLFACLVTLASAFLDRKGGLHLFSLPELRSPLGRHLSATGAGYRHLRAIDGQYPEVHDTHEFIGSTPFGFVVLNSSTIVRNTTISTDDYSALLATATVSCTGDGGASAVMTIDFPRGVNDMEGFEHLAARVATPNVVLTLGVDTLLKHPSFDEEGSCVTAFPDTNPYFFVSRMARSDLKLTLDITPAAPRDAFAFLSVNLQHSPDTAGEVARRKAAGLYLGRDLSATNPANYQNPIQYGVNWNGQTGSSAGAPATVTATNPGYSFPTTAASDASTTTYTNPTTSAPSTVSVNTLKLPFFPPINSLNPDPAKLPVPISPTPNYDLFCQNCFWYSTATLNVQIQICAVVTSFQASSLPLNSYTSYFDASLSLSQPNNGYYYISSGFKGLPGQVVTSDADAKSKTDCATLGTPNTQTVVNAGISAAAWLEGPAYFNFIVKSEGLKTTTLPEYTRDPLKDLANVKANDLDLASSIVTTLPQTMSIKTVSSTSTTSGVTTTLSSTTTTSLKSIADTLCLYPI